MDKDKIPVKYSMSIWKTLPKYPTREDVLYELMLYMEKNLSGGEFSEQTFNGIWYDHLLTEPNWKGTKIEERLNEMFSDGTFEHTKDKGDKAWYKITKTPFV